MKFILVIFLFLFTQSIFAKRSAPEEVKSVIQNGVEYTVKHWGKSSGLGQNGGFIEAKDAKTKKVLWKRAVYKIDYDKNLEGDVQDVFINSLSLSKDKKYLLITNEIGQKYQLNLQSTEVHHVIRDRRADRIKK